MKKTTNQIPSRMKLQHELIQGIAIPNIYMTFGENRIKITDARAKKLFSQNCHSDLDHKSGCWNVISFKA